MTNRWTKEQIWDWYNTRPWPMGCNFVPAITFHCCELWQDDTRDEVLESVKKELELLRQTGMNTVRMFLSFHNWYFEREKYFDKLDQFLSLLESYGVTMMPVIFNDCAGFTRPEPVMGDKMSSGWQKYVLGHHGGVEDTPFSGERLKMGWILHDEPEWVPVLEQYLHDIIERFAKDERIYAWDLWNEPGNSNRHEASIPHMERAFEIARSLDPIQPLTAGPWEYPENYGIDPDVELEPIQRLAVDLSDIITFHQYQNIDKVKTVVARLEQEGRPMMNTEWLHRIWDNFVEDDLPFYHEKRIGSYNWGLVAGKSQFYLPWDWMRNEPGLDLSRWQHDLYREDHTPYNPAEIELFKKLSPRTDI